MYLLIAIVLIAELIIATTIICQINKLDKQVVVLSDMIVELRPEIKKALDVLKESVAKLVVGVHALCKYAEIKKQQYTISIIKNVLLYSLLFILKGKSRKCVSAVQFAAALKDCWDKGAACNS